MSFVEPIGRALRALGFGAQGPRKPSKEAPKEIPVPLRTLQGQRWLEFIHPDRTAEIAPNNWLARHAKIVTSQDGEDGVLAEIFRRLGIVNGWCVEFGALDGKLHANTWDLVHNNGWKAVYIEPQEKAFQQLRKNCEGLPDVHCFNEFVAVEGEGSLDSILSRTPLPIDFDLLVIDIDGNDYFIWKAFEKYRPKLVMVEFSRFIPPDVHFVKWNDERVQASASLAAVCDLAKSKGYELICAVGNNAFMIRSDLYAQFEIQDNRPASMFQEIGEIKLFQGYEGTLFLTGNRKMSWRLQLDEQGTLDNIVLADDDVQVLPRGLRVFRPRLSYRNEFLEAQANRIDPDKAPSNRLLAFRDNVTSECGEDGILRHIFARVGAGGKYCVDVGAHDGRTFSSTWSPINDEEWSGLLIEKEAGAFKALGIRYADVPRVKVRQAEAVTHGDNALESLLQQAAVPPDFDFLCLDVEGNDYNLWASLTQWTPRVVMIDFNPSISNDILFAQQDDPAVHDGASLRALVELARLKGYELSAVTMWNAIFVRRDLFPRLELADNTLDRMHFPVLETRVFQSMDGYLSLVGCDRLIRHDYIFDEDHFQPLASNVRRIPIGTGKFGELRSTFFWPSASGAPDR